MAEITINESQLDHLAEKLGDLSERLSDDEQALLFTLLAVGARTLIGDDVSGFAHYTPGPRRRSEGRSFDFGVPESGPDLRGAHPSAPWKSIFDALLVF